MWVAAWLLCYQTFYKLDIVPGRKIDSDDQRVENPINHVTIGLGDNMHFLSKSNVGLELDSLVC